MENIFKSICLTLEDTDPAAIAVALMEQPQVPIHGPVHHILDGSAFLTALHNAGMEFDLAAALDELAQRGSQMPGATCGLWGVCGSAASLGAALAIVHQTGPLSDDEYYRDNLSLTSAILKRIAEVGGPRCCKRNAFLALSVGADFVEGRYGLRLERSAICCGFSGRNEQCLGTHCPFHRD